VADDKNKSRAPQTLQLDEEAPQTLQLDEAAGGTSSVEPTDKNLPGSTPLGRAAIKSGVTKMVPPTKFEQGKQIPENYGFSLGNIASNAWEGAKGLVGSGYEAGKDLLTLEGKNKQGEEVHGLGGLVGMDPEGHFNPLPRISALAHKYVIDPAASEQHKSQAILADTNEPTWKRQLESAGHGLASEVPLVGPWAAHLGEKAGTGDIGGTAGEIAGTVGAGEALPKIAEHAPAIADKIARGTPITEAGKIEAAKQQALTVKKPSMTETEYSQKVTNALPDLQKIAQDNKGQIKTPRQAVQAINNRISQMEAPISKHLESLNNSPAEMVHPDEYQNAIGSAIDQELSKKPGSYKPAEIEKAKQSVMNFVGDQPKSLQEIEGNRRRLNQDADAYYNTDTAGKRAIDVSDATAVAQRAAANKIRSMLYGDDANPGLLEKAGVTAVDQAGQQMPMRDFRNKVGNLLDVRDHFEDAITKAEAEGNWHPKPWTGPSLAAGGVGTLGGLALGGPIGALFGTIAGEGAKAWGDYLRSKNANLNVQKMFRNLEQTSPPNTASIQTRAPIHQYDQPVGPQMQAHSQPIGPNLPPGPFELGAIGTPAARPGMWQQQVGAPPDLGWGGPTSPYREPIGPQMQHEAPLGSIHGTQLPLGLAPENAPLFNIQTPNPSGRVPELGKIGGTQTGPPVGMAQEQSLSPIGGHGREGVLGRVGEGAKTGGLKLGKGEDLGEGLGTEHIITKNGERIGSITVEEKENGKTLHVHWLGGDIGRAQRAPLMQAVEELYPNAERFTYDRRRLAKGAEAATTEPREMPIKKLTPPKS
jgi:hypothetical protein